MYRNPSSTCTPKNKSSSLENENNKSISSEKSKNHGVVSYKRQLLFEYEKSIRAMQTRMPAVEYNCHENKPTADRLYRNDEWISTGHAAGLRGKHREECTGETAQRRHGKDGLQQTVCGVLPTWENRVFTEDSAENHGVWVYAQADIQPCA